MRHLFRLFKEEVCDQVIYAVIDLAMSCARRHDRRARFSDLSLTACWKRNLDCGGIAMPQKLGSHWCDFLGKTKGASGHDAVR
jgi:hypothetical protein